MIPIPDVLGMPLARAERALSDANVPYEVSLSVPPKGERPLGVARVIRIRPEEGGKVHLVVSPTLAEPEFEVM